MNSNIKNEDSNFQPVIYFLSTTALSVALPIFLGADPKRVTKLYAQHFLFAMADIIIDNDYEKNNRENDGISSPILPGIIGFSNFILNSLIGAHHKSVVLSAYNHSSIPASVEQYAGSNFLKSIGGGLNHCAMKSSAASLASFLYNLYNRKSENKVETSYNITISNIAFSSFISYFITNTNYSLFTPIKSNKEAFFSNIYTFAEVYDTISAKKVLNNFFYYVNNDDLYQKPNIGLYYSNIETNILNNYIYVSNKARSAYGYTSEKISTVISYTSFDISPTNAEFIITSTLAVGLPYYFGANPKPFAMLFAYNFAFSFVDFYATEKIHDLKHPIIEVPLGEFQTKETYLKAEEIKCWNHIRTGAIRFDCTDGTSTKKTVEARKIFREIKKLNQGEEVPKDKSLIHFLATNYNNLKVDEQFYDDILSNISRDKGMDGFSKTQILEHDKRVESNFSTYAFIGFTVSAVNFAILSCTGLSQNVKQAYTLDAANQYSLSNVGHSFLEHMTYFALLITSKAIAKSIFSAYKGPIELSEDKGDRQSYWNTLFNFINPISRVDEDILKDLNHALLGTPTMSLAEASLRSFFGSILEIESLNSFDLRSKSGALKRYLAGVCLRFTETSSAKVAFRYEPEFYRTQAEKVERESASQTTSSGLAIAN